MFYLIGMGLYDERDLTLRALDVLKTCDMVYVEYYTSPHSSNVERINDLIGNEVVVLDRKDIEERPEENVLKPEGNTALLVSGDPMVATTHIDLILRAHKVGIKTRVIHAPSVYSAVGETGLQLYKFGKTTTLAIPEPGYEPTSPYLSIVQNKKAGLHTLVLLDIKEEEGRYMTVDEAINQLLKIEKQEKEGVFTEDTLCVGVARLGGDTKIKAGKAGEIRKHDFGKPPHILIVPAELHFMEKEALERFKA